MNVIYLNPTDVLFFRDGRPMTGSLSGHGAAWPLPNVINHAFHAALWRASIDGVHSHRRGKSGIYRNDKREERFGSLRSAGPFPVFNDEWLFPRPLDLVGLSLKADLLPLAEPHTSSLPKPLRYPIANTLPPSKDNKPKAWLTQSAMQRYLLGQDPTVAEADAKEDGDLFDAESQIGIAIDSGTQTTGAGDTKGGIYSAHYLRLKELDEKQQPVSVQIGALADAYDKDLRCDLIETLLGGTPTQLLVGGQQRMCNATRETASSGLPLPSGMRSGFHRVERNGTIRFLVKWVLLSPAVFPEITVSKGKSGTPQPGGWLPNWICTQSGSTLLKNGNTERDGRESRTKWRSRVQSMPNIRARLVSAIIPKPLIVTGWALTHPEAGRMEEGAKPTHLAVPAGAVYYFEADTEADAVALAAALNWHGSDPTSNTIRNRRSTLLGEKGFGIGVCGTWDFYTAPS